MSPYLRADRLPCPPVLPGERVSCSFGVGHVERVYWLHPARGESHWRCVIRLADGAHTDCGASGVRLAAQVEAIPAMLEAAE